ncbi:hypothetical protein CJ030_MR8G015400 [Morella rubra]|uniref:Uncharacterized protein n=1 Tax=Morella rubra TaxID=262757 RepID=A0A6A1UV54_9ROSI|nr:hypothetical protein CJ030_MR8G015400 [Morella rubra]
MEKERDQKDVEKQKQAPNITPMTPVTHDAYGGVLDWIVKRVETCGFPNYYIKVHVMNSAAGVWPAPFRRGWPDSRGGWPQANLAFLQGANGAQGIEMPWVKCLGLG